MSVFQDLYDSEINFKVSCLWDGGFEVSLGDEVNGYSVSAVCDRWEDVERWLSNSAIYRYPDSVFAKLRLSNQLAT